MSSPIGSLAVASTDLIPEERKEDDEEHSKIETRSDPRRWYIVTMFSLLVFTQNAVWNTWGSISNSANYAFGWDDKTIFLLSNWGPITYITSTVFFSWLADVKGLRVSCVLTSGLVATGCGLRCITSSPPAATWLIHCGQILNGFGGPIPMGCPPLVSAVWFPVHQRTMATAVMTVSAGFGVAISYIIAPLLVIDTGEFANATNVTITVPEVRDQIMVLLYIEFALSGLIFLAIAVYFPIRPSIPPSVTATVARIPFKTAIGRLLKNYRFWMLSLPFSISSGVNGCWGSVLDVNLNYRHISQDTAGFLGFWMSIASTIAGLIVGVFADIFSKRMKLIVVSSYMIGAASFLAFCLMYYNVFDMNIAILYVTNIITSACLGAAPPLLYELICESTFPVAEGITNIFMTSLCNLFGMLFLFVPMFMKSGNSSWMNAVNLAAIVVCIPVFAIFPENYQRFDIDTRDERTAPSDSEGEGEGDIVSNGQIQEDTRPLIT